MQREVTSILKDISSKDHSFFFAQLRSEAKEGPFDKVKVRQVCVTFVGYDAIIGQVFNKQNSNAFF